MKTTFLEKNAQSLPSRNDGRKIIILQPCQCDICREEQRRRDNDLLQVTVVQSKTERFVSDDPLSALLIAIALGQAVVITTEEMKRDEYARVPTTSRVWSLLNS